MGWERKVKSDVGLFRDLQQGSIGNLSPQEINNYSSYYVQSTVEANFTVDDLSGEFPFSEMAQGEARNLFGFRLYQNGSETNLYAVCRCTCTYKKDTAGNISVVYGIRWKYYDSTTGNYSDIASYDVDGGLGQVGSIKWNSMHIKAFFKFSRQTFHGVEQNMLYGGLYCSSLDSSNYGAQYHGESLGVQGIGNVYNLSNFDPLDPESVIESPEFGPASIPDGGYNPSGTHGSFDNTSDTISVPALPTVGVTTAGFINVYKIEQGDLNTLGEKLFPHFLPAEILADPSLLTTPEVLTMFLKTLFGTLISPIGTTVEIADNLGIIDILMNGKLIDYILDCHIIPVDITGGTSEGLKVGYRQFNDIMLTRATSDYVNVNCGSLSIPEYWANALDYLSTVKLFLPFVGFVNIDNEFWDGGTISVEYNVNIVDGSFQAFVVSTSGKSELNNSVIAQYGGVCCVHLPITGLQYSNVVAGLVNGSLGAVAKGSEGNSIGAATNIANMAFLRPDAPSSNGYNASNSFLSMRKPYLLIERPASQFSELYPKEMGLPLNVSFQLSKVHGFTIIDNPVLRIACSDSEYQEIVSLLKNGVILP